MKRDSIFLELTNMTTRFLQNQSDTSQPLPFLFISCVLEQSSQCPYPLVLCVFGVKAANLSLGDVVCECWCVSPKVEKLFKQVSDHVLDICNLMLG